MWQQQEVQDEEDPYASPSRNRPSKWWHVADGEIEDMIQMLNTPQTEGRNASQSASGTRRSALREQRRQATDSPKRRQASESPTNDRSVRFSEGAAEEDSLDQALRESNDATYQQNAEGENEDDETFRQDGRREPDTRSGSKRGAWKAGADAQLLEFVKNAKKVLSFPDTEEDDTDDTGQGIRSRAMRPWREMDLPDDDTGKVRFRGGYPPASSSSIPKCSHLLSSELKRLEKPGLQDLRYARGKPGLKPQSRIRQSSIKDLSSRPQWAKSASMPSLFAGVGVGLDGKGNKVLKPGVCQYEETPIFLSDKNDKCFERVRVAVCGHPYYMQRG